VSTPNPVAASDTVTLEIDGKKVTAKKGQMIIQAADAAGIYIPRFCYHHKLSVAANCRMCLVDMEKAPKPMPACATPVGEGMIVRTRSEKARDAQKSVMEFLLINHPLDCPICDQGGECQLQDLAMGYGKDVSRYIEAKRIVKDKDIGPLIATEMTRCIHCTRCVRFGQEVAGIMEFGGLGRGEHMEIRAFLDSSIDSELSGNVIDLCPVGALTSKPFRYTARPWELESRPSVSPHDCVGSNVDVEIRRGHVMRVLPRENGDINECWLSDRDRFSYEAIHSDERLLKPMIRRGNQWEETDWQSALEFTAAGLKKVVSRHGANEIGALAHPASTVEEIYLLQKLMRALGSGNVDHRLRQVDFADDAVAPNYPSLGQAIADLERVDGALLIGSNLRKDQPILNLRLRKAALKGAWVGVINPIDYAFNYKLGAKVVTDLGGMLSAVAGMARALAKIKGANIPAELNAFVSSAKIDETTQAIADRLASLSHATVLVGNFAQSHPQAAALKTLAAFIAQTANAKLAILPEANSAGAWLVGGVPHRGVNGVAASVAGRHAGEMLRTPLKAYVLLGTEPEFDCLNGARATAAMQAADFVVMLTAFKPSLYKSRAIEYADVWLPLSTFAETAGSFVNAEGKWQTFEPATLPVGEARPGWKILRVLANHLNLAGFEYVTTQDVRGEIGLDKVTAATPARGAVSSLKSDGLSLVAGQVMRLAEVPPYAVDGLTRRSASLQATADNPKPAARFHPSEAAKFSLKNGDTVRVVMQEGETKLTVELDARVPPACTLIASGSPETASLGAHGPATILKEGG
jgi:NADH-quinone oxidoreductase subunit G